MPQFLGHFLEYSISDKAKCRGHKCGGVLITKRSLRYGRRETSDVYGEITLWTHWGCLVQEQLQELKESGIDNIMGYHSLRNRDKDKVRKALRAAPGKAPTKRKSASKTSAAAPPMRTPPASQSAPSSSQGFRPTLPSSQATVIPILPYSPSSYPSSSSTLLAHTDLPSSSQPMSSQSTQLKRKPAPFPLTPEMLFQDEDEDFAIEDELDLTDELIVATNTEIVGVQYYKGLVGPGEEVRLIREPHNRYDRNAVQVMNIAGQQVGHLPRKIVLHLAPLMDQGLVTVEGVIHAGNLNGFVYAIDMTLKIYGLSAQRTELEPRLLWASPGGRDFTPRANRSANSIVDIPPPTPSRSYSQPHSSSISGSGSGPRYGHGYGSPGYGGSHYPGYGSSQPSPSQPRSYGGPTPEQLREREAAAAKQREALQKAADLKQMLDGLEKVNDEGRRESVLDSLCSTEDVLNLPEHPDPPGKKAGNLVVDLLKHQSQALQWCLDREYPKLPTDESAKPVQFWQRKHTKGRNYYYNMATKTPQEQQPILGRGGLCADSMGLGKTLTMLSVILATRGDTPTDFSRSTLIVAPLSVMSNWEAQIKSHCAPHALSSFVYYGTTRSISASELEQFDVVITTYQVVSKEFSGSARFQDGQSAPKKSKGGDALFSVNWKRVILDEGHIIRNPKTKIAQSVCALNAQRRWVVTGTPIINSPMDLGSMLSFLRVCRPLDDPEFFKRLLLRPLKLAEPAGAELLRALMNQVAIRRTKEMHDNEGNHLVPLPPVDITQIRVKLSEEARELYDNVEGLIQRRVENYISTRGPLAAPTNILSLLTRLRQLALHPGLVPSDYIQQLESSQSEDSSSLPATKLTPQDKVRLQNVLAQLVEDSEECPICFFPLDEPKITPCAHAFCKACIKAALTRDQRCPMDRRNLHEADLLDPPPPTDLTQAPIKYEDEEEEVTGNHLRKRKSAKVHELIELLKLLPFTDKALVFSQFTSFLDKIAESLEEEGIPFVRFDGKLSARRRKEAIERFTRPVEESEAPSIRRTSSKKKNPYDSDDSFIDDGSDNEYDNKRSARKGKKKAESQDDEENPRVMLISLKAGALGLNLTVANNVFLMDPWWQEGIESQAIDRCNRIGQTKPVHVYQLIAENTIESKVLEIQERKKRLIKEAYSGTKSKETERQKREARLQDIIEILGLKRKQGAGQGTSNSQTNSQTAAIDEGNPSRVTDSETLVTST